MKINSDIELRVNENKDNSINEDMDDYETLDVNFINHNEPDFNNLLNLFKEVNIKEEGEDNWFKNLLKDRISLKIKKRK